MAKRNKWWKGKFEPKNPEKYIGTYPIIFRSSWEWTLMQKLDSHPNVIQWASESIKIPYWNPFKKGIPGKPNSIYVPDFLVNYQDRKGQTKLELIEIKPMNQTSSNKTGRSKINQIAQQINTVKWAAARVWAKKHGMTFRVMTENNMFLTSANRKKK